MKNIILLSVCLALGVVSCSPIESLQVPSESPLKSGSGQGGEGSPQEESNIEDGNEDVSSFYCPEGKTLTTGHSHAKLECLPHLDAVQYHEAASKLKSLDSVKVTVAVIDGYFNSDHVDLKNAIDETFAFANPSCDPTKPTATCTNVKPKISDSTDLGQANHGTEIAGVIAGRGSLGNGVVGVNPSARLVLLGGDSSNYNLRALAYAIKKKVDVISISWPLGKPPGDTHVPEFENLVKEALAQGIVIVTAAGNRSINVDSTAIYPTRYSSHGGVIAVGASKDGALMTFSNYGPQYVDIAAPGVVATSGGDYKTNLYSVQAGTSFSGPMVAGAVSRIIQHFKKAKKAYTPSQIEDVLLASCVSKSGLGSQVAEGCDLNMKTLANYLETL